MSGEKSTSPWVWAGCGCALVMIILGASLAGVAFYGARRATEMVEELRDPAMREAKALETLGTSRLPEGYYPMFGMSIPFVFETAILTDIEPSGDDLGEPEGFDERGFIYFKVLSIGRQQEELEAFFEGRTNDPEVLRRNNINVDVGEQLGRGEVSHPAARALYSSHRGSVSAMGSRSEGLTSLIMFDCEHDDRTRLGIWFGPGPRSDATRAEDGASASAVEGAAEGSEGAADDLVGTPADPAAIEAFVADFRPCA